LYKHVQNRSGAPLAPALYADPRTRVFDVREPSEFAAGALARAVNIPHTTRSPRGPALPSTPPPPLPRKPSFGGGGSAKNLIITTGSLIAKGPSTHTSSKFNRDDHAPSPLPKTLFPAFPPGAGFDRGRRGQAAGGPYDPHRRPLRQGPAGPGGPGDPPEVRLHRRTASFTTAASGVVSRCGPTSHKCCDILLPDLSIVSDQDNLYIFFPGEQATPAS